MKEIERELFVGDTAEGDRVYMEIRLSHSTDIVTLTDHTQGVEGWRLGMSWTLIKKGAPYKPLDQIPDGWWISAGQIPPEERVVVTRRHPLLDFIQRDVQPWHLNNICPECDHMTPDMLAMLPGESATEWRNRMLDTCVCPGTGYRWGHSRLVRRLPDSVLTPLSALLADTP